MTNVFEQNSNDQNENVPADPMAYVLEKFKGENGELDLAKLAKAKLESDLHIKRIEREAEELRGEVKTRVGLEEFLTKMTNKPPQQNDTNTQSNQSPPNESPAPIDIEKLVEEKLTKAESNRIKQRNLDSVNQKLTEIWGDEANSKFRSTANDLGMSIQELKDLAEKSPEAFFRVTNIKDQGNNVPSVGAIPRSTTAIGADGTVSVRNDKYYRSLKKSNPSLYFSAKTQVQMHQDAIALGEKFYQ